MRMVLKNPGDIKPGVNEVELVEAEPDMVFELCDPKMAENARYWQEAVIPLRELSQEIESHLTAQEFPDDECRVIRLNELRDWVNTLNTVCP